MLTIDSECISSIYSLIADGNVDIRESEVLFSPFPLNESCFVFFPPLGTDPVYCIVIVYWFGNATMKK